EKDKAASFEESLEQLEAIVGALEAGGLPLDESLQRFEEGIRLFRACDEALKAAEEKIELLTRTPDGTLAAQPFGEDGDDGGEEGEPVPPPGDDYEDEDTLF